MRRVGYLFASTLVFLLAGSVQADGIRTTPVQFDRGESSATIEASISGSDTVDYTLRARAGQDMRVTLTTSNGANYFNVLPPGSKDVAIFIGSSEGNEWQGTLPSDGEYKVRVYLMRSAARRNEVADYTLNVSITGTPQASPLGEAPAGDAKVEGTPYHATGWVRCVLGDVEYEQCEFGVIRGAIGNAEVHITPPGGLKRVLTFMGDTVTSGDEKVVAVKQGDEWSIEVNDFERYRVVEGIIFGG